MKSGKMLARVLLSGVVLLAATAFAAEKTTVQIDKAVTVNGSPLAAGKYTVTWEGAGPSVELKFMKGKNEVANVPAQVVKLGAVTVADLVVTRSDGGNSVLTQIQPGGKKFALVVGGDTVQTAADHSGK